jgi:hypothetical protein
MLDGRSGLGGLFLLHAVMRFPLRLVSQPWWVRIGTNHDPLKTAFPHIANSAHRHGSYRQYCLQVSS